jgi:hypothetical protein
MSTLSGQTIQSTYQGLLKLANSTTGITSNLQAIEDGLGNNTGVRITTNQLESPNIGSYIPLRGRYYGAGFTNVSSNQMANGTQNIIIAQSFYDLGQYSYSAMSYHVVTATSTSDSVEFAIYTAQQTENGIFPHTPIMSGMTLTGLTTTGVKDFVFSNNLSFSGYGAGLYFSVFKVSNSGVQPTIRFGGPTGGTNIPLVSNLILGFSKTATINQYQFAVPVSQQINALVLSGQTTFDNPFSSTIYTTQSMNNNILGSGLGFILHTTNFN